MNLVIIKHLMNYLEAFIEGFKEKIFPLKSDDKFKDQQTSKKLTKEKEESEKTNFLNILTMKQKILTMVYLIIILILWNLEIWQKNYLK